MRRDLDRLEHDRFDLLVIGGGLHGAMTAWDATLRGLRTALVEQADFCSGTTGNSLRVVHGGLRALQRGNLAGLRESAREQATLLRIAPDYLTPLPCLIPLRRHDRVGAAAFHAAFSVMRLATGKIRRVSTVALPASQVLSRAETTRQYDGFDGADLVGGALWYDAQVPELERLVLALLTGAASRGAQVSNYVRVEGLSGNRDRVQAAEVVDQLTGRKFLVKATSIINAAGPWTRHVPYQDARQAAVLPTRFARGVNIIANQPPPPVAIGVRSPWSAERDPVVGGHRFLFVTPWHDASLAGTSYIPLSSHRPELPLRVQVERLVAEINAACPALRWFPADIVNVHSGRLPLQSGGSLLDRGSVVNHAATGHRGLISIVAAKFTTARLLAEQAVDMMLQDLGQARPCETALTPVDEVDARPGDLAGRVRFAIEHEMAYSLDDVLTRRLGMTLARCPHPSVVAQVADIMRKSLGWSEPRRESEIRQVLGHFAQPVSRRAA